MRFDQKWMYRRYKKHNYRRYKKHRNRVDRERELRCARYIGTAGAFYMSRREPRWRALRKFDIPF